MVCGSVGACVKGFQCLGVFELANLCSCVCLLVCLRVCVRLRDDRFVFFCVCVLCISVFVYFWVCVFDPKAYIII